MKEESIFKAGDTVRFHDGVMHNGQFLPFTNSKAPHRYEGQIAKLEIEEDHLGKIGWRAPALVARFPDGGTMYLVYDGVCHDHHWTIADNEVLKKA